MLLVLQYFSFTLSRTYWFTNMKNVKIKYEVPTELWVGRHLVCGKCGSEGDLEETDDVTFNPLGVTLSTPMMFHSLILRLGSPVPVSTCL